MDFAPTVLHFFGLPVPDNMEGRVLCEAFRQDDEVKRETPPDWIPCGADFNMSPEEEQAIEARLADLGYL